MKIKLVNDVTGELRRAIAWFDTPVKLATTAAIKVAGDAVKNKGRSDIAQAGFSVRWQRTWRVNLYPTGGKPSVNAAAWAYHKIPYAEIYERGGRIIGSPTLWIPLRNAPIKFGREKVTPARLMQSGIKLFPIRRPGKKPLLATNIWVSRAAAKRTKFAVSASALRRSGTRPTKGRQVKKAVPLFVGVSAVNVKKRFHLGLIADQQRDKLAEYYFRNLKV